MTQGGENQQNIKSEDNSEVHGVNCYSDGEVNLWNGPKAYARLCLIPC